VNHETMNLNKLLKTWEMKNKRKVYVYSETRDYMTAEYIDIRIHERGACKRNRRRFRKIHYL
jgi:hypothetical protein